MNRVFLSAGTLHSGKRSWFRPKAGLRRSANEKQLAALSSQLPASDVVYQRSSNRFAHKPPEEAPFGPTSAVSSKPVS
jgi:hypothetical protein